MKILCLDWDQTLVDTESQEWLPGALDALRWMRGQGHKVIIHSVRAERDYGRNQIEEKLRQHKLKFEVLAKPYADLYVDDKAQEFDGSWPKVIREIRAT
jgi:predicted HAD superfamily phosphohydrolase YqeG